MSCRPCTPSHLEYICGTCLLFSIKDKTWKKNQWIEFIHHVATGSFGNLLIGYKTNLLTRVIVDKKKENISWKEQLQ